MTNDGGPAFPNPMYRCENGNVDFPWDGYGMGGMSLRDWFAGQVLAGLWANPRDDYTVAREDKAVEAYRQADAMLAARDAKQEKPT